MENNGKNIVEIPIKEGGKQLSEEEIHSLLEAQMEKGERPLTLSEFGEALKQKMLTKPDEVV